MNDRNGPFSIEAEQAVLGAILFDNAIMSRLRHLLKATDFFDPVHQLIYKTIVTLADEGGEASPTIVDAYLSSSQGYKEAGGRSYIINLAANVPAIVSAGDYARLVADCSAARELRSLAKDIDARASTVVAGDLLAEQFAAAGEALHAIGERFNTRVGFKPPLTMRAAVTAWAEQSSAVASGERAAGISTGLDTLDKQITGLCPEDLIVLGARPSMGKTSAAVRLTRAVCQAGLGVYFSSQEISGVRLMSRIAADLARTRDLRVPYLNIDRGTVRAEDIGIVVDEMQAAADWALIIDETDSATAAHIRRGAAQAAKQLARRGKALGLVVVDYLGLMAWPHGFKSKVDALGENTRQLKALARELQIPVLLLCQLNRALENRDDKRPQVSDLRDSGNIEEHADKIGLLYRPAYYLERNEPAYASQDWYDWKEELEGCRRKLYWHWGKNRHGAIGVSETSIEIETCAIRERDFPWFAAGEAAQASMDWETPL